MKTDYLSFDIKGLPPLKRLGHNTRKGKPRNHIYKVNINGNIYYILKLTRSGEQFCKYFKKKKDAKMMLEFIKRMKAWI